MNIKIGLTCRHGAALDASFFIIFNSLYFLFERGRRENELYKLLNIFLLGIVSIRWTWVAGTNSWKFVTGKNIHALLIYIICTIISSCASLRRRGKQHSTLSTGNWCIGSWRRRQRPSRMAFSPPPPACLEGEGLCPLPLHPKLCAWEVSSLSLYDFYCISETVDRLTPPTSHLDTTDR